MDLITKRIKLKEIVENEGQEKKVNEFAQRFHIKADEIEYVNKGFGEVQDDMEINEGERAVIKYVSTISVDRDGDIILPKGIILDDFTKNPVVLYGHNYGGAMFGGQGQLPIGRDLWIKPTSKGILAKQRYAKHTLADDIYNLHKDGMPLASSIGFIPIKWVDKTDKKEWDTVIGQVKKEYGVEDDHFKGASRIYTKTYLLEHSDVPVPSNPDALTMAIKSGGFQFQSKDLKNDLMPEKDYEERICALEKRIKELELINHLIDDGEYFKDGDLDKIKARINQLEKYVIDSQKEEQPKGITAKEAQDMIKERLGKISNSIDIKRGMV